MSFLTRLPFLCPLTDRHERVAYGQCLPGLVHEGLCTCVNAHEGHVLTDPEPRSYLAPQAGLLQWVSGSGCDMDSLPLHVQDLSIALTGVFTVYSSSKGCSRGWMSQSTQALASQTGLSLLELISASNPRILCWRCFHVRAVHVQLPLETNKATDAWKCEGAAGFLNTSALTALLAWSPGADQTQVRESEQQDPGSLLHVEPNAPSRQPCPCSAHPSPAHPVTFTQTFPGLIPPSLSKIGVNPGWCCVYMRLPYL